MHTSHMESSPVPGSSSKARDTENGTTTSSSSSSSSSVDLPTLPTAGGEHVLTVSPSTVTATVPPLPQTSHNGDASSSSGCFRNGKNENRRGRGSTNTAVVWRRPVSLAVLGSGARHTKQLKLLLSRLGAM